MTSPGLTSAYLSVKLQVLPISVEVVTSEGLLFPGEETDIVVRVQSSGEPLPQAKLTWTATHGTLGLGDTTLETDENGEAGAIFRATDPGDGLVGVKVSKVGYEEAQAQAMIDVVMVMETDKSSPSLFGVPILFLFMAVSAALLGYKFWPVLKRQPRE